MQPPAAPVFIGGLDLGQVADPTALAVLQKDGEEREAVYTLLVLRRFELKTSYMDIVDEAGAVMTTGPLKGAPMVLDETGVGRAVADMAQERLNDTRICRVTITGGHAAAKQEDGSWHVAKKVLVTALALVHQSQRLIVPRALVHGPTLAREMQTFKSKITASANETFEAWREGQHDDLVLAVALAVWGGENLGMGPWDVTTDPRDRLAALRAPAGVFVTDHLQREAGDDQDARLDAYDRKEMGEEFGGDDPTWHGLLPEGGNW